MQVLQWKIRVGRFYMKDGLRIEGLVVASSVHGTEPSGSHKWEGFSSEWLVIFPRMLPLHGSVCRVDCPGSVDAAAMASPLEYRDEPSASIMNSAMQLPAAKGNSLCWSTTKP
jgi:hypothetical protein